MVTSHGRDHRAGLLSLCTLGGKRKWQIHAAPGRDLAAVQIFWDGTVQVESTSQFDTARSFQIPPARQTLCAWTPISFGFGRMILREQAR